MKLGGSLGNVPQIFKKHLLKNLVITYLLLPITEGDVGDGP
jgi:hypothetical protein